MEEVYYVYALISEKDNRIYVGFSSNLDKRLKEHNSGKTKSTKGYRPWKLIYNESIVGRQAAR
ncbi:endonuclease [Pedobacter psychrophilus]|uniref:Endonuclease n=1 Tax=Pedobacter psychrophilus TaxID=1826909 RepID=A0A179DBX5_9SPHI|nr:GIY-YIG nuclease family protein [Pedobacter psychrophilus]OAQ38555.1 endonuclease [Pedobacter psychrophilus]